MQPRPSSCALLRHLGLATGRIGAEFDSHGLTHADGRRLEAAFADCDLVDASDLATRLRAVKSPAEIAHVREAARLCDLADAAGLARIGPGADEGDILAAQQAAIFANGGDYPANEFIIG